MYYSFTRVKKRFIVAPMVFFASFLFAFITSTLSAPVKDSFAADSASSEIQVNVPLALNLQAPTDVALTLSPNSQNGFGSTQANVVVSTNNKTGYTLTMSNNDANTNLTNINPSVSSVISSITTSTAPNDFSANTWGYSKNGGTSYEGVPPLASPTTLKTTAAPSVNDTTAIHFGARITGALPSGSYKDVVVFTATTNYVAPTIKFFNTVALTNMQNMTEALCTEVTTPANTATSIVTSASAYTDPTTQVPEITLTDTRDNKTYKVRKLADGNCWMSENLRLGGTNTIALNSTNSNLPEGSTFTLPIAETSANHTAWATGSTDSAGANTPHVYNTENNSYGNHYNWYTAVAGTANYSTVSQNNSGTITPNDAPGSICPKGWYLPGNGNNADYRHLLVDTYGLVENTTSVPSIATLIQAEPLSFVLGGVYSRSGGAWNINFQGQVGLYWSRTPLSSISNAVTLYIESNGRIMSRNSGPKTEGRSVRCVASPALSAPF